MAKLNDAILYNLADAIGMRIGYHEADNKLTVLSKARAVDLGGLDISVSLTAVHMTNTADRLEALFKVKGNLFMLVACGSKAAKISLINFAKMGCTSKDFVASLTPRQTLAKALGPAVIGQYVRSKATERFILE